MYMEASLDGHYLDTHVVEPSSEPQFFEELTWLMDKKKLRKLRMSGANHVRLNCYSLVSPHQRVSVGFLQLCLKHAQIQTEARPQVKEAWHKLIGVRSSRPELLLGFSVRSATLQPQIAAFVTAPAEHGARGRGDGMDIAPRLVSERGSIQIGPQSSCSDVFLLTVVVGEACHLHLLLTGDASSQNDIRTFHFCYTICGNTVNTKNFSLDPSCVAITPADEKIKIRIRSSLSALKMYFDKQSVMPFQLISGDEEVASTTVNLKTLIPTEDVEEFRSRYACDDDGWIHKSRCCFASAERRRDPDREGQPEPSVDVILALRFVERQAVPSEHGTETSRTYTLSKHQSAEDTATGGSWLQQLCAASLSAPVVTDGPGSDQQSTAQSSGPHHVPSTCLPLQHGGSTPEGACSEAQSTSPSESRLQETISSHVGFRDITFREPQHCVETVEINGDTSIHRYDLCIYVECVRFQQLFEEKEVFFKFHHPHAEEVSEQQASVLVRDAGEDVPVQGVSCRLGICCSPAHVAQLLLSCPPHGSVCARGPGGQTLVLASSALDTAPLLATRERECCYWKSLQNVSTGQQVSIVKISLVLEDSGPQLSAEDHLERKLAGCGLERTAVNELTVFKTVEELEEWRLKQQEMFAAQMCEKEKAHLERLKHDWDTEREGIEAVLEKERDRCCKMAEEQERVCKELEISRKNISKREEEVRQLQEKLEAEWTDRLLQLEELTSRMERDADKESQWRRERTQLEQRVADLQQELEVWKERARLREAELEEMKKIRLTQEQVTYLCQELKLAEGKLDAASKLKSFYKEQWCRAVKEILHVKTQNRQALHINITKNERNQLMNLRETKSVHEMGPTEKAGQDCAEKRNVANQGLRQ
ncbi:centrosomal protein of 120 kDa-like isoform X2 [Bacillus rossius redtenbacheri]